MSKKTVDYYNGQSGCAGRRAFGVIARHENNGFWTNSLHTVTIKHYLLKALEKEGAA